jgi:hypothetical protein
MAVTKYANNDVVAVAFLKTILGQSGGVGTELPAKVQGQPETWKDTGFVQVTVVGGSSSIYNQQKAPVMGLKCWAVTPDSRRPPWQEANNLAETIRAKCFGRYTNPVFVALPTGYPGALVHDAHFVTDPIRVEGDDSAYACYLAHLQMYWKATS